MPTVRLQPHHKNNPPMMACGHSANGTDEQGNPVCVICVGIVDGARTVVTEPDLSDRKAKCAECTRIVDSKLSLAFFRHLPGRQYDQ